MSQGPPLSLPTKVETKGLRASFGTKLVLQGIDIKVPERRITAVMGPSGCGKTTFIRCLNRIHELTPGATVEGEVILDGMDVYSPKVGPVSLRRRGGRVYQKPNPFTTMSIWGNVTSG